VVDAALDSVQDEISSQLAEVESRELARIEYALERMREGNTASARAAGWVSPGTPQTPSLRYVLHQLPARVRTPRRRLVLRHRLGRLLDTSTGDADLSINDIELDVS